MTPIASQLMTVAASIVVVGVAAIVVAALTIKDQATYQSLRLSLLVVMAVAVSIMVGAAYQPTIADWLASW